MHILSCIRLPKVLRRQTRQQVTVTIRVTAIPAVTPKNLGDADYCYEYGKRKYN